MLLSSNGTGLPVYHAAAELSKEFACRFVIPVLAQRDETCTVVLATLLIHPGFLC
jgi:hypothetical protein